MGINAEIRKKVNIREVYRYLGYGAKQPDSIVEKMICGVLDELTNNIKPKHIYKIYACNVTADEVTLKTENDATAQLVFASKNLSANLMQCDNVALMAATLGLEADKLMQKYEVLNMAKASIVQACGAACIEAYCDIIQEKICSELSSSGTIRYLRPRFSPGYGDLPLQNQKIIFDALQCTKRIGLTLTDSLLMYPTKSVTAFIGFTANPQSCHIEKCKNCDNIGCEFRNESYKSE